MTCDYCEQPMHRRPGERPNRFAKRRYCSPKCSNTAKAQARTQTHGVSGYRRGCRCEDCVVAWRLSEQWRKAKQHAARNGLPPPPQPTLAVVPTWIPPVRTPCADNPDDWFPDRPDTARARAAAAICAGCPVRAACDTYAHETRQDHGIWAGTLWQYGRPKPLGGTP